MNKDASYVVSFLILKVSRLKLNPKLYGIESKILRAETLNPVLKMLEMFPAKVYTNSAAAIYEIMKISGCSCTRNVYLIMLIKILKI